METARELLTDLKPQVAETFGQVSLPRRSSFSVVLDDAQSLQDLKELFSRGYSVIRSSHAGNLTAANIVVAQSGVTFLLHEYLPLNDETYNPGKRISGTKNESLLASVSDKLALWVSSEPVLSKGQPFDSPIHMHVESISSLWPNSRTVHDLVLSMGERAVRNLLDRFLDIDPEVAHAYVDCDGNKLPLHEAAVHGTDVRTLLLEHFPMIQRSFRDRTSPTETIIPDTAAMIVLSTIADLVNPNKIYQQAPTDVAHVYHLAGVQMVNYLVRNGAVADTYINRIEALYAEARTVLPSLPERLVFHLIPTSHLKDYVTTGGREKLEAALDLAADFKQVRQRYNDEKGKNLQPYLVELKSAQSFADVMKVVQRAQLVSPQMADDRRLTNGGITERDFLKNSEKLKGRIIGVLASYLISEEVRDLEQKLARISAELRQLKKEGAVTPLALTQYDLLESGSGENVGSRPIAPRQAMTSDAQMLSELMGIIKKA